MGEVLLAKSNGTSLKQHTRNVIQAVKELKEKQLNPVPNAWWEALYYAALLHDLGKIDPLFQAMLKKSKATDKTMEIPHSLLSLFLFDPKELPVSEAKIAHTIVSAVAFHHWRDSFPDLLMGFRASDFREKAMEFIEAEEKWQGLCQAAAKDLYEVALEYGLKPEVIKINHELVAYLQYHDLGSTGLLVPPYTLAFLPAKIRSQQNQGERERLRVFVTGTLMRADHFASLSEDDSQVRLDEIAHGFVFSAADIKSKLATQFKTPEFWQKSFFKDNTELQGETMLLVAPTGFGKTEFAYLWGAGKKNLMLLPMRTAVNKTYERSAKLYREEAVALLHGDAALQMAIRGREQASQETEGEQRKALELARHLSKPYIVATADQIAPAALRYPGYEKIFANLMDGALIIDEVQAYDPVAAAIVTHLIQQNSFFGGKTLLMTATLPPFIREAIKQRVDLDTSKVISLLDLLDFKDEAMSSRHRIRFMFHEGDYEAVVKEIVTSAQHGKKVLVIMNTVKAACEIYQCIRLGLEKTGEEVNTALLHSRFTFARRQELEELIVEAYIPNKENRDKAPCIVVSTQVVEASLDIDADLMFTEPAPADSLIQRMGRVYRRFARSKGINAPEQANVVIMINKGQKVRKKKDGRKDENTDIVLGSGIGAVYDRALTVISLVVFLKAFEDIAYLGAQNSVEVRLEEEPWNLCFRERGKAENKKINRQLGEVITNFTSNSLLINEKEKIKWVEETYRILGLGSENLDLGRYIDVYQETLDMLDHGYCSDKKRDAMRVFRNVNDVSGIPNQLVEAFYEEIEAWVQNKSGDISYIELAVDILPRYVVNCPYRALENKDNAYDFLDINRMLPEGLNSRIQDRICDKLKRWLSDIRIFAFSYDNEKGLLYYEP